MVGKAEGLHVGTTDGGFVSMIFEGALVGPVGGLTEGIGLGDRVGLILGELVGFHVGSLLGDTEIHSSHDKVIITAVAFASIAPFV